MNNHPQLVCLIVVACVGVCLIFFFFLILFLSLPHREHRVSETSTGPLLVWLLAFLEDQKLVLSMERNRQFLWPAAVCLSHPELRLPSSLLISYRSGPLFANPHRKHADTGQQIHISTGSNWQIKACNNSPNSVALICISTKSDYTTPDYLVLVSS